MKLSLIAVKSPLPQEAYERNATVYKAMGSPKRLEILNILKNRELTVEQIIQTLGIRKANVSQHLAILRYHHLVTTRRDGQRIYYRIIDPKIVEPCKILHDLRRKNNF